MTGEESFNKEVDCYSQDYKSLQSNEDKYNSNNICEKEIIENIRNKAA